MNRRILCGLATLMFCVVSAGSGSMISAAAHPGNVLIGPDTTSSGGSTEDALADSLHDLFDREWTWRVAHYPLSATVSGWRDTLSTLPDVSPTARDARAQATRAFLNELEPFDHSKLSRTDQISADLLKSQLRQRLRSNRFASAQIPVHTQGGFHQTLTFLPRVLPFRTAEDYRRYIRVLEDVPRYVGQQIANMRRGLDRGMTQPRIAVQSIARDVAAQQVDAVEESPFYAPFRSPSGDLTDDEKRELRSAAAAAVRGVVDAYESFAAFLRTYADKTRTEIAATALPDGDAYYASKIRQYTTLDVSADEVHAVGKREVNRIRGEMEAVMSTLGVDGDLQSFIDTLRADPRFTPSSPEALLKEAAWIAKQMDGKLPSLFGTLPRQPYTVVPVPDELAPTYTVGRYIPAPAGGTRAGEYWVNTYDLERRTLYTLEALTLHEAVPGHHLQVALAREMDNLPAHRRNTYVVAFGEGWGLYAERLGLEAGFYDDPYSNFGRLTYEMWRACRLVVDTGMHAKGWSRQRAIDYMSARTALPENEVETEIDRYISWPGQALGYKMGEIKIRELRQEAEAALGRDFDIGAFHDVVLGSGPVTLPVLEENVGQWIERHTDDPG
ncbi:DUF885 domain-containing protein [Longibacter sp.]|uniref:DUF885 domain-containing protein n=1 Tax=Longibacter sp. TaxID=2045415 RepID=UPI003EB76BCA